MKHAVLLLVLLCLLVPALGCDKASPVAPAGSTLAISANPSKIGLNGSSTITVVGRKPDGNPLNPGTEIRLSTDRGTLSPSIVEVDSGGRATATLRGGGVPGPAIVEAFTADATVKTTVQIGETTETKPVVLVSANPSTVPVQGTATVTVVARNSDGSPIAGQTVILTSTLGELVPPRPTTRADGTATSTLNAKDQSGTATITAIVGASDAATTTVTIRDAATGITLRADPASITGSAGGDIELIVNVVNSQGLPVQAAPVTFSSQKGRLETTSAVFTNTNGEATNTLTLTQEDLNNVDSFTVTAQTPGPTGNFLTATVTIDVN